MSEGPSNFGDIRKGFSYLVLFFLEAAYPQWLRDVSTWFGWSIPERYYGSMALIATGVAVYFAWSLVSFRPVITASWTRVATAAYVTVPVGMLSSVELDCGNPDRDTFHVSIDIVARGFIAYIILRFALKSRLRVGVLVETDGVSFDCTAGASWQNGGFATLEARRVSSPPLVSRATATARAKFSPASTLSALDTQTHTLSYAVLVGGGTWREIFVKCCFSFKNSISFVTLK